MRADSGFYTHAIVAVCRKLNVRFSITIRQSQSLRSLIEAISEADWTPVPYWMDGAADVAETSYTPFQSEPGAAPVRLIVRRVKPTPGSQLALLATYSYHGFITDRDGDTLELEADHRRHAEIENAIRDPQIRRRSQPSPVWPFRRQWRLAGGPGDCSQPGALDGAHRPGRTDRDHQDPAAAILLPRRSADPLGAPTHPALASALALGGPVHWRPDPVAHPAASLLTAALLTVAPATGTPRPSLFTNQSKISPTRAARIGQRGCLVAFGHCMSGSPHRQQACYWPRPSHIRRGGPLSTPVMSCSSALPTPFGGFGLN